MQEGHCIRKGPIGRDCGVVGKPATRLNTVHTEYRTSLDGSKGTWIVAFHTVKRRAFGDAGFLPAGTGPRRGPRGRPPPSGRCVVASVAVTARPVARDLARARGGAAN